MYATDTQEIIFLKDEALDIDHIDRYRLSFFISATACQWSICNIRQKRLLLLEERLLSSQLSLVENLQEIYNNHTLIAAGFWKEIRVFIRNDKFSLVPSPIFDSAYLQQYISLNVPITPQKEVYDFKVLDDFGLSVAFGYPFELKCWFEENYPRVSLYFGHQSTGFLNALKPQLQREARSSMYLLLNQQNALIAGFNLSRVAIYNQFCFADVNQLLKLVLLTAGQFSDTPQQVPLLLFGNRQEVETYLPALKKYFLYTQTGQRPSDVLLHPIFNELEEYEYFDVLSDIELAF